MDHRKESSDSTSLEKKLEQITSFCESEGFSVQKIVLQIKNKLCELWKPLMCYGDLEIVWKTEKLHIS